MESERFMKDEFYLPKKAGSRRIDLAATVRVIKTAVRRIDLTATVRVIKIAVPYKNIPALLSVGFGIFAILPYIGLLFGFFAVIFGLWGLVMVKRKPTVQGKIHALTGIFTGVFFGLLYLTLLILFHFGLS